MRTAPARPPGTSRLSPVEKTDRQILGLLADDGRMSYTDLGKATGLSTSAVHQRVKRLEERGLILGYGATIDHAAAGQATDRVRQHHAVRRLGEGRLPRPPRADQRDRVVLVGRGGGVLHPQGAGRDSRRPRGAAGPGAGGGQRLDADHDRAVHAVREPSRRTDVAPVAQVVGVSGLHRFEVFRPTFRPMFTRCRRLLAWAVAGSRVPRRGRNPSRAATAHDQFPRPFGAFAQRPSKAASSSSMPERSLVDRP